MTGPVSIYMPAFNGGGAENALIRLLNHWAAEGRDMRLIVNQATGPLADRLAPEVPLSVLGVKSTFANLPRLVAHLRAERPAVLMTALLSPNVAGVAAARLSGLDLPVVCLVRNHTTRELAAMPGWRRALIRPMLAWAYGRAAAVGCVATEVSRDLVAGFGLAPEKLAETFNPILLPPDAPRPRPPYFPPAAGGPVIVAVGRLVPQKGYDTLLAAFARLRATRPARLVILGQGGLQGALQAHAQALGIGADVTFAGFQPDPLAALAHADLFTLMSEFEGFPNVVGEALAMGCRIVATDAPGGTGDILGQGAWGHLVPVGDAEAAARAFGAALDGPHDPARQRARAAEFSIAAIAQRYLDLCAQAQRSAQGAAAAQPVRP